MYAGFSNIPAWHPAKLGIAASSLDQRCVHENDSQTWLGTQDTYLPVLFCIILSSAVSAPVQCMRQETRRQEIGEFLGVRRLDVAERVSLGLAEATNQSAA